MEMKEEDAHDSVGCPADKNMTRIDPLNLYLIIRGNARIENQFGQVLGTLSQRSFIGGCSFILEDENLYKHKLGTFSSFHLSSSSFIFYSLPYLSSSPFIFYSLPMSTPFLSPMFHSLFPSFILFLHLLFPPPNVPFPSPTFYSLPPCSIPFPYLLFPPPCSISSLMLHSLPLPSISSTMFHSLPPCSNSSPQCSISFPYLLFSPPCFSS